MAILILLGFVGVLRTGEILALTYQHLVFHSNQQQISLVIPESKNTAERPPLGEIGVGPSPQTSIGQASSFGVSPLRLFGHTLIT